MICFQSRYFIYFEVLKTFWGKSVLCVWWGDFVFLGGGGAWVKKGCWETLIEQINYTHFETAAMILRTAFPYFVLPSQKQSLSPGFLLWALTASCYWYCFEMRYEQVESRVHMRWHNERHEPAEGNRTKRNIRRKNTGAECEVIYEIKTRKYDIVDEISSSPIRSGFSFFQCSSFIWNFTKFLPSLSIHLTSYLRPVVEEVKNKLRNLQQEGTRHSCQRASVYLASE